jgi:hypothetical protein
MGFPGTNRVDLARNARSLIEDEFDVRRQAELLRSLSLPARQVA